MEFGFEKEDTYMRGSVIDYGEYSSVNDCRASKGIQGDVGWDWEEYFRCLDEGVGETAEDKRDGLEIQTESIYGYMGWASDQFWG